MHWFPEKKLKLVRKGNVPVASRRNRCSWTSRFCIHRTNTWSHFWWWTAWPVPADVGPWPSGPLSLLQMQFRTVERKSCCGTNQQRSRNQSPLLHDKTLIVSFPEFHHELPLSSDWGGGSRWRARFLCSLLLCCSERFKCWSTPLISCTKYEEKEAAGLNKHASFVVPVTHLNKRCFVSNWVEK